MAGADGTADAVIDAIEQRRHGRLARLSTDGGDCA
jgi:hypothetical protein